MLNAVIFDFDGIIVDTEPLHYQAFQTVLKPYELGYSWQEYLEHYIGFDDRDAFREAFSAKGKQLDNALMSELIAAKAIVFQEIIKTGVTAYPGVVSLLKSLSGVLPLALCSGALAHDIVPILKTLDLEDVFTVTVTADDVAASKPDPQSYALALQRLGTAYPGHQIRAAQCLAIEDTPAGIASATGAGLHVLAVTNSYEATHLTGASMIVDSLESMTLQSLSAIIANHSS